MAAADVQRPPVGDAGYQMLPTYRNRWTRKGPAKEDFSSTCSSDESMSALKVLLPEHSEQLLRRLLKECSGSPDAVLEALLAEVDDVAKPSSTPAVTLLQESALMPALVTSPPTPAPPTASSSLPEDSAVAACSPTQAPVDQDDACADHTVQELIGLGFDEAKAREAVMSISDPSDANLAMDWIFEHSKDENDGSGGASSSSALPTAAASSPSDQPTGFGSAQPEASAVTERRKDEAETKEWTVVDMRPPPDPGKFAQNLDAPVWQPLLRTGGKDPSSDKATYYDVQTDRLKAALAAVPKPAVISASSQDMHGAGKGEGKGKGKGKGGG